MFSGYCDRRESVNLNTSQFSSNISANFKPEFKVFIEKYKKSTSISSFPKFFVGGFLFFIVSVN
jgi:hypothetical protein